MKAFKLSLIVLTSLLVFSCSSSKSITTNATSKLTPVKFRVNLNDLTNDTFKVSIEVPNLTSENNIFYFAATAPGTYQTMNIGRFVRSFKAFDKNGNEINTTQTSTNQFEISSPNKVHRIEYEIAETFDTPVIEYSILPMGGTSIEKDHVLINGQAVFGYFKNMQDYPLTVKLDYPVEWILGTALELNQEHTYTAENYDHIVDSPILLGELSKASLEVSGTKIDILTYAENGTITSDMVLETLKGIILSAEKYLDGLPVDHYTFLFHFETNDLKPKGAWEHSYSSGYTLNELPWEEVSQSVIDAASHEFFHIVTPLNIHSEIIHEFNFTNPVASKHLWLYEGVTEWAAHMMLFRTGYKSLEDYLHTLTQKVYISENYFDNDLSLLNLSLNAFSKDALQQYPNIYMKGALTAGLLDIRLLELSKGKTGLIDIIKKLSKKYGPRKPFNDASFFDDFTTFTNYQEIEQFINLYIKEANALPLEEYYAKVGVRYDASTMKFEIDDNASKEQIQLRSKWLEHIN